MASVCCTHLWRNIVTTFIGTLSTTPGTTALINPIDLRWSANNQFLYVLTPTTITVYSWNGSTGSLTFSSSISPAATPGYALELSPDGLFAYVSSSSSGNIAQFSINTTTGALTALTPATITATVSPKRLTISPDGLFVYCGDGSSAILEFSRNTSTGLLTALPTMFISASTVPEHISISTDGISAYGSHPSGLTLYTRNTSTGALTISTLYSFSTAKKSVISSDGAFVYVIGTNNTVYQYSRNITTGALTALSTASITTPNVGVFQDITISADGASVYGALDNFGVAYFTRDTVTGLLTYTAIYKGTAENHPIRLAISSNSKFLYASYNGTTTANGLVATYTRT